MTKNELLDIQNFIKEMRQSDDDIEVMKRTAQNLVSATARNVARGWIGTATTA